MLNELSYGLIFFFSPQPPGRTDVFLAFFGAIHLWSRRADLLLNTVHVSSHPVFIPVPASMSPRIHLLLFVKSLVAICFALLHKREGTNVGSVIGTDFWWNNCFRTFLRGNWPFVWLFLLFILLIVFWLIGCGRKLGRRRRGNFLFCDCFCCVHYNIAEFGVYKLFGIRTSK